MYDIINDQDLKEMTNKELIKYLLGKDEVCLVGDGKYLFKKGHICFAGECEELPSS